jgi:signal transduction histidine kinase/CheY-like chemotaxis protein
MTTTESLMKAALPLDAASRDEAALGKRILLDETHKTERVLNYFRAGMWTGIGAVSLVAEYQVAHEISSGAMLALLWGLSCALIELLILRRRFFDWLPWVVTSMDITVVGFCMYSGCEFARIWNPAVVPHQVYGSGFVMLVVVASNLLRFSPWISLASTVYGGLVYALVLNRTLGLDALSVVEMVLMVALGAMLVFSSRKLRTILRREREQEEQLRQLSKMEAVGQMSGGIAHDFNNLLTVILGNGELLMDTEQVGSPSHELGRVIVSAAQRGATLTRRLLAYARRQALEMAQLDCNQLVAGLVTMLRRSLGEHVEIRVVPHHEVWPIMADAGQLENALLNLAVNARDAMPDGGKLTISTENVTLTSSDAPPAVKPGDYVRITVKDTGTGMSPAVLNRAFDPFFTTKEVGKGSGLGLSMVYGFLRQSGGYVNLISAVGAGTSVELYLPRHNGPRAPVAAVGRNGEHAPTGRETILVVEDDALVRRHAVQLLETLGYTVLSAGNAKEALAIVRTPNRIDLLFSDVVMPGGMDGPHLATEARGLRPGLKVLLSTGYSDILLRDPKLPSESTPLIPKPYRRMDLAQKLRDVLETSN